jgi:hypothetical protein
MIISIWCLFFLAALSPEIASAKDYHFKQSVINVRVNTDGSFDFEEQRTFAFEGSFHWADLTVLKEGAQNITGFQIREGSQIYGPGSELPGTVSLVDYADRIYAKWFYSAQDEEIGRAHV